MPAYSYFKKGCQREWRNDEENDGKCRMEVARPKRTVVTLFDMPNFISCVHLAGKGILFDQL